MNRLYLYTPQCPRTDYLDQRLPQHESLYPIGLKSARIEIPRSGNFLLSKMKNQFLKNLCSGTQCGGFQFLMILDLWDISFHAVVVFGLGKNLYLNLF